MGCRVLFIFAFVLVNLLRATDTPEKVYRITYVQKPNEWYKNQSALWEKVLQRDKSNEEAWMNLYKAQRYAKFDENGHIDGEKQKRLDDIITEMKKYIPDTYTYYYLSALNAKHVNEIDVESLEYAYTRWPRFAEILYELILYYEVQGNKDKVIYFTRELYASEDIARGLLEYNANMLLSVKPGSILFTNGDNDTYPTLVLQKVRSFREDVTVINVHMAFGYRKYLAQLLQEHNLQIMVNQLPYTDITDFLSELVTQLSEKYPEKNIFMAATLNKAFIDLFKERLYLVGLAYQFSTDRMDNLSILKENIQKNLRLDYLSNDWYSEKYPATPLVTRLNQNYVVIFMNLAEYLAENGQAVEAQYYQKRALQIAVQSDNTKMIQMIKESQF